MISVPTVSVVQFDNDLFHLLPRQRSYKSDEEYSTTGCGRDKIMQHIIVEQNTANMVQHRLALQKSIANKKCQRSNTRYHHSLHATVCHIGQYYTPYTIHHNTTQHIAPQHITTHYNTTQHITTHHITSHHNTTHHNTTQHNTSQHNTTQHITTQHNTSHHNT